MLISAEPVEGAGELAAAEVAAGAFVAGAIDEAAAEHAHNASGASPW